MVDRDPITHDAPAPWQGPSPFHRAAHSSVQRIGAMTATGCRVASSRSFCRLNVARRGVERRGIEVREGQDAHELGTPQSSNSL